MLTLRGFMGTFGGHLALYWGVQFLLPSEAAALWSTAPFFALLFGYIILKEVLSATTVTMICLGFAGVLLVIQPVELVSWLWTGGFDLVCTPHVCIRSHSFPPSFMTRCAPSPWPGGSDAHQRLRTRPLRRRLPGPPHCCLTEESE
jgi:drug/metabolite transporter (DMT)-like permease